MSMGSGFFCQRFLLLCRYIPIMQNGFHGLETQEWQEETASLPLQARKNHADPQTAFVHSWLNQAETSSQS